MVCISFIALWWGRRYIIFFHCRGVPTFPVVVTVLLSYLCARLKKKACSVPTSCGRWYDISTIVYRRWKTMSAPKGWSFWTPYWRRRLSALLIERKISPFPTVLSIEQGVLRGHRVPSSSLNSPWGWFHISPSSLIKCVEAWWVQINVHTMFSGPPVGTGITVSMTCRSAF